MEQISFQNNKVAIAIFVKTPGVSPVKTRLAKSVGVKKAEDIYLSLCKNMEQVSLELMRLYPVDAYWAVAEIDQLNNPLWKNLFQLHTGEGGLGERMENVYHTLLKKYRYVFLMGSDSPQISAPYLHDILLTGLDNDIIITPAMDGGFCLLGGKVDIPSQVWIDTPYSQANTLEIFLLHLKGYYSNLKILPPIYDIDTVEDLEMVSWGV